MTTICGIDPSLTNTAVVGGDGEAYFVSCFPSGPMGSDVRGRVARCDKLVGDIDKHLEGLDVDLLLIEGYSYNSKQNSEYLGEYGGILRWHLVDRAKTIYEVAPATLKKFASGTGKGDKSVMCGQIAKRWGVTFGTNDEYDAFALYRMGIVIAGLAEADNDAQREAVAKVIGPKVPKPKRRKREAPIEPPIQDPSLYF